MADVVSSRGRGSVAEQLWLMSRDRSYAGLANAAAGVRDRPAEDDGPNGEDLRTANYLFVMCGIVGGARAGAACCALLRALCMFAPAAGDCNAVDNVKNRNRVLLDDVHARPADLRGPTGR